ncbi:translation-associated GTPase [Thermoplasma sp. Kam2015]|uniref:YchF-related putative GTPase n=1 Tax=Thermoplasma sp. Kam2015 TaxID=2094122 RepID=UPI000D950046|nr:YchF-related putative GTPase [Thermoplasma sp. Kam2015]PYB68228.1 translation-associated GTPase [Thermoplasma sp. Kam2015]
MSVKIGLVGEPNVGKSTFYSAATQNEAEIGDFPFTTVKPNLGMTFFTVRCPDSEIGSHCNPREGYCENGIRHIPVQVIDVPGLIEGASEGRGMGNEFLDAVRDVDAIVLIVDISSGSIENIKNSINLVMNEIKKWFADRIYSDWDHFSRRSEATGERREIALRRKLSLFGVPEKKISEILEAEFFPARLSIWTMEDAYNLASAILKYAKPVVYAGNKGDKVDAETIRKIIETIPDMYVVSAEYELAVKRARNAGMIDSVLTGFKITGGNQRQREALEMIDRWFRTPGVVRIHDLVEKVVKNLLHYIVVYPVYDENKWTDKAGNVLPDAYVMVEGSTALDLAFRVHTDIGEGFIRAINGRTKMILGRDYVLKDSDVIKIISKK